MSKANNRIMYVDLFRAIGIILMIMGHVGFGSKFSHWIHAFHMPMFFFASGFFYKGCSSKVDLSHKFVRRCKSLLVPYLVFSVVRYIINYSLGVFDYSFLRVFVFNTSGGAGAIWFLTALFVSDTIYSFIDWKLQYGFKLHIVVILLSFTGNILGVFCPNRPPFGFDVALVGIGFIHLARIIKREPVLGRIYNLRIYEAIILFFASSILIFLNGQVNLRTGHYGFIPLFWLNSVLIIISGWNICKMIDIRVSKPSKGYAFLLSIGQDSIEYLCLNQLLILLVNNIFSFFGVSGIVWKIVELLIVIIAIDIIRRICAKTKMKVLFGK